MRPGTVDPEEMEMLADILFEYAAKHGLVAGSVAYEDAAIRIMDLFVSGVAEPEDIRRKLGIQLQ